MANDWDAIIVGSGPNGLVAAITLAEAGRRVLVIEGQAEIGGGLRSAALTRPGVVHDVCAGVFPLAVSSRAFTRLPLAELGAEFIHPSSPLAHPFDDGTAIVLERALAATVDALGEDGAAWHALMAPLVAEYDNLVACVLRPWPTLRSPRVLGHFAQLALQSAQMLARRRLRSPQAQALFAGLSAHAGLALDTPASAAFGLLLGAAAHAVGWPLVRGGAGTLAMTLADWLRRLGGEIVAGQQVTSLNDLPHARAVLFDTSAHNMLAIAGAALPQRYRRRVERFRPGPGVFKIDYALDGPVPWQASACRRAATLHLGSTLEEIARSEHLVARGQHAEFPFVIAGQPSLFDASRVPEGIHTCWAYCHVPNDSTVDMTERIEAQIERFAPGFRQRILVRHCMSPQALAAHNPNCVGGDISGGSMHLAQIYTRPTMRIDPYTTPNPRLFLCSSATPPGGGVHGLPGYFAAQSALRRILRNAALV